ncbi:MAG TPA: amidohydrolase [Deltaproteobacteria bacterium]|nr:amidohydrolase [Deltaproteobacteria bacterium]
MRDADICITGGTLLLMDEAEQIIHDGAVVMKGDTIVAVGGARDINSAWQAGKIIDARNCIVMPGLVNAHTHAAMTCFRGISDDRELMDWLNNYIFPAEAKNVDPELAYWGTLLACAEMIRSGTTTFCDMYLFEDETALAASEAGMRCLAGEGLFDFPSPNAKTPEEGLAYTRMLLDKWTGHSLISIAVEPHALYTCSAPLLKDAKTLADEYGAPMAVHLLENLQEKTSLEEKLGMRATVFLRELGILDDRFFAFHCVAVDEEDIDIMADHGCKVVHNPESNMKLASGIAPVTAMLERGIIVGLGTDGAASNNNLDMFQEMDTAAKLEKVGRLDPTVMPASTVTRMATRYGATALGMEHITGSLETGKKADIIIIDMDKPHLTPLYNEYSHLAYAVHGDDVITSIINGKIVMENRQLLTIDEAAVMNRVRAIAERIRTSLAM